MITLATVTEQLGNAIVEGYSFTGWTAEEIASDLIAYSEDFFDVPKSTIIPLIETWRIGREAL